MLDVGWSEILVIAVVMIVVVGPKDLPKMLRAFGKATARMRTTANEFKRQFDDALKEAELDDVKNLIDETRKLDPRKKMTQVFDPIRSAGNDLKASLNQSPKPVDASLYQDDAAEKPEAEPAKPEAKTPSDAIAEAVKKNLPEKTTAEVADKAEEVKPVKAKAAPKTKTTAKVAAAAKKTSAKLAVKPAAKTTTKATAAKVKTAAVKPVAAAKTAPKKAPVKKTDAKPTGTNE